MRIAIIDYRMSNLFSISNALNSLNYKPEIISRPELLKQFDAAVLPGVGSFPKAIKAKYTAITITKTSGRAQSTQVM